MFDPLRSAGSAQPTRPQAQPTATPAAAADPVASMFADQIDLSKSSAGKVRERVEARMKELEAQMSAGQPAQEQKPAEGLPISVRLTGQAAWGMFKLFGKLATASAESKENQQAAAQPPRQDG